MIRISGLRLASIDIELKRKQKQNALIPLDEKNFVVVVVVVLVCCFHFEKFEIPRKVAVLNMLFFLETSAKHDAIKIYNYVMSLCVKTLSLWLNQGWTARKWQWLKFSCDFLL